MANCHIWRRRRIRERGTEVLRRVDGRGEGGGVQGRKGGGGVVWGLAAAWLHFVVNLSNSLFSQPKSAYFTEVISHSGHSISYETFIHDTTFSFAIREVSTSPLKLLCNDDETAAILIIIRSCTLFFFLLEKINASPIADDEVVNGRGPN